jgi:bacillithiol biosynthesis deacetylase BshB1
MPDSRKLDILAIAAHPDDVEITCGGLLIKMMKRGRKTGVLDLTKGEMGTYGDATDRLTEATEGARILGLANRYNLELPDSAVEVNQDNKLKIAAVIRNAQPELVILPHWNQRHPDHLACSQLGYDACFLAGLRKLDLPGEPHRPRKIIYVSYFRNQDHSFLVDISDEFEQKMQAVAAYKSQFGVSANGRKAAGHTDDVGESTGGGGRNIFHPGVDIFDLMRTRARQLGQLIDVLYAEGYSVKENILIDDPQKTPVRSV